MDENNRSTEQPIVGPPASGGLQPPQVPPIPMPPQNPTPPPPPTPPVALPTTPQTPQQPQSPIQAPAPEQPQITVKMPEQAKESASHGLLSLVLTIVAAIALTQLINLFFFQSYRVFGSSMYPTLHDGDRLIISKVGKTAASISNKKFEPKRGNIVVFTSPKDKSMQLIKRVIGLPGERVVVKNGTITVYNTEHPDGFNPDKGTDYENAIPKSTSEIDTTVPKGHIFVSGDNREGSNSLDSRNELGTVPEDLLVGTLSVRLWPLNSAGFF